MEKSFSVYCMEDSYQDNFSKLALAATSAQIAKNITVQEFGVGEDLTFNFMGWNYDELVLVCQLSRPAMLMSPDLRLSRCESMALALRRYWGITAITMIAEGYCSLDPAKTKGVELAKEFTNPESAIEECIAITHAEIVDDSSIEVNLIALPYLYHLGRTVVWLEPLTWPTQADKILRNSKYPKMLENCLRGEIAEDDVSPEEYDSIRGVITAAGFFMQEFF